MGRPCAAAVAFALALPVVIGCDSEPAASAADVTVTQATEAELLAGVWVRTNKAGRVEYEFRGDGTYSQRSYPSATAADPTTVTDGSFSAEGGVLTLSTELSTETGPYARDGATFSREQVFLRKAGSDGAAGTWEYTRERKRRTTPADALTLDEQVEDTITLHGGGTMEWSHRLLGPQGVVLEEVTRPGTWSEEGSTVTTQDAEQVLELKRVGDTLYDTRGSWLYQRK